MKKEPTAQPPLAACLAAAIFGALAGPRVGAATSERPLDTFAVTNCEDSGAGSLRDALANAVNGGIIDLTELACSTISLQSGALVVGPGSFTLMGPGRDRLWLDGANNVQGSALLYQIGVGDLRIYDMALGNGRKYRADHYVHGGCVHSDGDVILVNVDIADCSAEAAHNYDAVGGAVFAGGHADLINSTVSASSASARGGHARGGGVAAYGKVTALHSTVASNHAISLYVQTYGGGIYAQGGVTALYSTISDNYARAIFDTTYGGGVFAPGECVIAESTIARNHATRMGGLSFADADGLAATIINSTVSGNSAEQFGGVYSRAPLFLYNSTITDNSATYRPDGAGLQMGPAATLSAYSSIIAGNVSIRSYGGDLGGESGSQIVGSNNLVTSSALPLPADTITDAVSLGPLVDNGGFSPTHALLAGSPGIDAGRQPPANASPYDQRGIGFARTAGAGPDIGAYELDPDRLLTTGFDFGAIALPQPARFPPLESFDEIPPTLIPALPLGWVATHSGAGAGWGTVTDHFFNGPNAAFKDDQPTVSDSSLQTPSFQVVANGRVFFSQEFKMEGNDSTGYDGVVFEISISGGPFVDILEAGGTFANGGYTHTLSADYENPLGGRQAWSGDSGGRLPVAVNLPASANAQQVRLRWRVGTDRSFGDAGYWLDDIAVEIDNEPSG